MLKIHITFNNSNATRASQPNVETLLQAEDVVVLKRLFGSVPSPQLRLPLYLAVMVSPLVLFLPLSLHAVGWKAEQIILVFNFVLACYFPI